jgi:hypothetical protein
MLRSGQKVVNGHTCDDWNWKETIGGIIVMEISDFFADQARAARPQQCACEACDGAVLTAHVQTKSTPVPVQEVDQLTPFGECARRAAAAAAVRCCRA